MGHDVFVCYASEDRTAAETVCGALESAGLRCWMAPRDVTPEMVYVEAIVSAIASARLVVLVFSSAADRSPHVRRELERAVSRAVPILPVRMEEVEPSAAVEYASATPTGWTRHHG